MKLRTLIFWPHLVAGLVAGTVILVMSVTGVLLTYERQLIAWSDSHYRSVVPSSGGTRLPIGQLIEIGARAYPDSAPTAVTVASDADAPVVITVPQRTVYVDAYSGAVLGEGSQRMRRAMSGLRSWHRWLAAGDENRPVGKAVTGWSNVIFAVLLFSGLYLWLPRTWSWPQVKAVLLFNGRASGKARDFNWHNVIGFWSAVPLAIVVVSAVPISFPWANAAVYRAVGEPVPAGRGGAGARGNAEQAGRPARGGEDRRGDGESRRESALTGLQPLLLRAERHVPGWRTINIRIPASATAPVSFAIDRGDGGQPHLRSTLTLTRAGAVESDEGFSSLTLGRRIRNVMRFAHTGEVLGIPGQTAAGLVSAGGVLMVWTGVALALRRFRAWLRRVSRRSSPVSPSVSSAA